VGKRGLCNVKVLMEDITINVKVLMEDITIIVCNIYNVTALFYHMFWGIAES